MMYQYQLVDRLSRGMMYQYQVVDRLSRGMMYQYQVVDRLFRGMMYQYQVVDRLFRAAHSCVIQAPAFIQRVGAYAAAESRCVCCCRE
jgi:hypothetical protein